MTLIAQISHILLLNLKSLLLFPVQDGFPTTSCFSKHEYPPFFAGMHKKTLETAAVQSNEKTDVTQKPTNPKPDEAAEDEERRTESPMSKEELRENSIAVLRAKAQEHSAKVLGTVSSERLEHKMETSVTEEKSSEQLDAKEEEKSS